MTATQSLQVDVPASEWLTANGRYHWAERARRVKALRVRANVLARQARLSRMRPPVRVVATVHTRTSGRFDPDNAAPTSKAIIDGLTDTGIWADDDHTQVIGPDHRRGPSAPTLPVGWHRITITITSTE